jgi:hypothetical protein
MNWSIPDLVDTSETHDNVPGGVSCPSKSLFTLYKLVHETGARPGSRGGIPRLKEKQSIPQNEPPTYRVLEKGF